uniref:Pentatricopeptide repeat-containing protein At4g02750 n=1 Tax=Anthurium amnicola TaxID=1678845 RepID=A0A1D1YF92_9ARAE
MYCAAQRIGNLDFAVLLLKQVQDPQPFIWNTAIRGYELGHRSLKAIYLYHQMLHNLVSPDKFTFPFVLKACANIHALEEGKQIHCQVLKSPYKLDTFVQDAVILMYSKCGKMEDACLAFDLIPHKRLICWNMMIDGYIKHGDMISARNLFDHMPQRDIFSWNAMIDGYAKCEEIAAARRLFDEMPLTDVISWNSMVDGYVKCGDMVSARELFDQMSMKDVVTWGIMINGYAKSGHIEIAHSLFEKTPYKNLITWNSLIHGYVKCESLWSACKLFDLMPVRNSTSYNIMLDAYVKGGEMVMASHLFNTMPHKDIVAWNVMIDGYARDGNMGYSRELFNTLPNRDVISWNALISGYKQNGFLKEAMEVFYYMLESGEKSDCCTLATVLSVIADLGLFIQGKCIHAHVERNNYPVCGIIGVALIDMYSKCGYVGSALQFFNRIPQKMKDHWNSMISGVAIHGNGTLAVFLFEKMEQSNVEPDDITFVGILNACSHAGLVLEGQLYFELMNSMYSIIPTIQHYGCMVDLLSRSGNLDEAMQLVTSMPMRPNDVVWRALLGASTNHGNMEIAENAAKQLIELVPNDSSSYVLLSNIYVSRCQFESARSVWKLMKDRSVLKSPGCSSIELHGTVHEFRVGDTSHAEIAEIHLLLRIITQDLMVEEYVRNTRFLPVDKYL